MRANEQKYPGRSPHRAAIRQSEGLARHPPPMYVIELSLRLSPMPVAVQRRELEAAQALYGEVRQALEQGQPRVLELTCEKEEHKRVSLLSSEIVAVQIYEKSATGTGARRPGFAVVS